MVKYIYCKRVKIVSCKYSFSAIMWIDDETSLLQGKRILKMCGRKKENCGNSISKVFLYLGSVSGLSVLSGVA